MFCFFLKSGIFDFISNVLANVSGLKEGREVIIDQCEMMPKIVDMLRYEKVNSHRRTHLFDCLRNLAFEYEVQEARFLSTGLVQELTHMLTIE